MFFSKIFQKFGEKHKGGPRQFFRVFKKISKITLIPCLKFFAEKHSFLSGKRSEIFDFRRKFCWNPWVNAKTSAAGEFFCWKMLVYMLKMLRKWRTFGLKNFIFGAVLLKNGKFWWKTLVVVKSSAKNFLVNACF